MNEITLTSQQRDLLKQYKTEAFNLFSEQTAIKENIKDLIEAAAEGTGLEKKVVSKLYKALYKDNLKDILEEAETLQFLSED